MEMASPSSVEPKLIRAFMGRCFSPSSNMHAAVSSGKRMGAIIKCGITFIL